MHVFRRCLSAALLLPALLGIPHLAHAQTYTLQDIGTLDRTNPYGYSDAAGVNDAGVVTGTAGVGSIPVRGYTWQNGNFTELPAMDTSPNYDYSIYPAGINSNGQVAGTALDAIDGGDAPWLFSGGKMTNLYPTMNSGPVGPNVTAINNAGMFVGSDANNLAFYYQNGGETPLPLFADTTLNEATALNNQNPPEIVGYGFGAANNYHAILWKNSVAYDIGNLGGPNVRATGINDQGQIVGYADVLPADANGYYSQHAFLWTPNTPNGTVGTMQDLGILNGGANSYAKAINSQGQVVGSADLPGYNVAIIWDTAHGMRDLNTLIGTANLTIQPNIGYSLVEATAINTGGQITTYMTTYYNTPQLGSADHGALLTPGAAQAAPGAPHNLAVAPAQADNALKGALRAHVTGTALALTWQLADTSASDVFVERQSGAGAFAQIADLAGDVTSYTDTGLTPGTVYTYRVRAHNATGDSSYSNTASAAAPAAPSHVRLLWTNTSGQASLWNVSTNGTFTSAVYGPYAGWTAKAVSDGPDGIVHLLWTNTSGQVSLWNVPATGGFTSHQYGPYTGYAAVSLSTGADGVTHLLWNRSDGLAALWAVNTATSTFTSQQIGPYKGWTAKAVASGQTVTDLLWTNANGQADGYRYAANETLTTQIFGPYANYAAKALSVGPDDIAHPLWDNRDGTAALWSAGFTGGSFSTAVYGPFSGWTARAVATGPDNVSHLLWDNVNGQASLWNITGGGFTAKQYGPYAGWTAAAVAAGP